MQNALLVTEFLDTPWAVKRERLVIYADIVARWSAGVARPGGADDYRLQKSAWETRREQTTRQSRNGIAVLPLYGTIVQRAGMMTEWSGGTSTQQFAQALRAALADDTVDAILIDIDSPGGSVYGVSELADEIHQARSRKTIVAIANSLAASAAYWIGSAASRLYVTSGGEVGSIGVWSAHEDWSQALEEMGVKTTLIAAGKYKTEGNRYQPLSNEARAFMQSRVNDYYGAFIRAVARGRGVPVTQVRDGMGQGRVLGADQALAEKMIDGIMTFENVVQSLQRDPRQASKSAPNVGHAPRLTAERRALLQLELEETQREMGRLNVVQSLQRDPRQASKSAPNVGHAPRLTAERRALLQLELEETQREMGRLTRLK